MTRSEYYDLHHIHDAVAALRTLTPLLRGRAADLLAAGPCCRPDQRQALEQDWQRWEHEFDAELYRLRAWLAAAVAPQRPALGQLPLPFDLDGGT